MADSNDIRDEFSPLLDDELSPDARDTVEAKLAQDAELLRELDALRKVDALYRGLPRATAPEDMAVRVQDQLHPKPTVLPLRTRRVSRTMYTSLAAAAMFSLVIGGLVIRQEFVVSPSAEDRLAASAPAVEEIAAEEASGNKEVAAFGDAVDAESFLEEGADSLDTGQGRRAMRGALSDDTAQTESRLRQESIEDAPAPDPESPATIGVLMERDTKDEEIAKPQDVAAAAPPPQPRATPSPSEGFTRGRGSGKAKTESAPMAQAADADAVDLRSDVEAQPKLAKKRSNAVERIANREFDQREDGWYERGYNGEPTRVLQRGSKGLTDLASAVPGLNDILSLDGGVVFQHGETWYRVLPTVTDQS